MYYIDKSDHKLIQTNEPLPIPEGWRRIRVGEKIPLINKFQCGDEWHDNGTGFGLKINRGSFRYIAPIFPKK